MNTTAPTHPNLVQRCLVDYRSRFQQQYPRFLPQHDERVTQSASPIYMALEYGFAAGGKHVRPALVYALADSYGLPLDQIDVLAMAIECIHTYSLIHDDLPAMDDDDLRRGRPACHKQFGEAAAILAGDALNTYAFALLAEPPTANRTMTVVAPEIRLKQIAILAHAAGITGMVAGQAMDLACENQSLSQAVSQATLQNIHALKTGKLIAASLLLPYQQVKDANPIQQKQLAQLGEALGLLYQIQDDILDVTQSTEQLGKPSGSDARQHKSTYVSLLGLSGAQQIAQQTTQTIQALCTKLELAQSSLANLIHELTVRQY